MADGRRKTEDDDGRKAVVGPSGSLRQSSRTCAVTSISTCCSGHVCRVQLGRQTTVTAGVKSGPSYRPDVAIDCSRLTKCKRARVTERNRGGPNNSVKYKPVIMRSSMCLSGQSVYPSVVS